MGSCASPVRMQSKLGSAAGVKVILVFSAWALCLSREREFE